MRVIYKYDLQESLKHRTYRNAHFIHVGPDPSGRICAWADVHTETQEVDAEFSIIGTGNPITENPGEHIGSFVDGPFVWHVYRRIDAPWQWKDV